VKEEIVKEKEMQAMRYKPSKYNFFFDAEDGTHLAFNAISNGFAKIEKEAMSQIYRILKLLKKRKAGKNVDRKLWNDLLKGKFIIREEDDELSLLKVINRISRFSTNSLSLAIAPTLECNFRCEYCYAEKRRGFMEEKIQSSLLHFIEKKAKVIKQLNIGWIGGEPLLAIDIIESLSSHFIDICRRQGVNYFGSLVTNGYLLTEAVVERLLKAKISSIQITLDGPQEVHDNRRPLVTGNGTFKVIIENLLNLRRLQVNSDCQIRIGIRVNMLFQSQNVPLIPKRYVPFL